MAKREVRFATNDDEVSTDVELFAFDQAWFVDIALDYDVFKLFDQLVQICLAFALHGRFVLDDGLADWDFSSSLLADILWELLHQVVPR